MKGVLNKDYHWGRLRRIDFKYRLKRRSYEVIKAIQNFYNYKINKILDIGTADGLMLGEIKKAYNEAECLGIEYSQELIDTNKNEAITIIRGDAQSLPFNNNIFDIVTAAAIIEHVESPEKMISEAFRVLKNNGLIIITTPNPSFEKIATGLGLLTDDHNTTFDIKGLKNILVKNNFKILETKKFMFSPIGFPFELFFEKIFNKIKLDFVFLNQIIIGKK